MADRVESRKWQGQRRGSYASLSRQKVHVKRWSLPRKKQRGYWSPYRFPRNFYFRQFDWRDFEPSHHKRFLLALVVIGLSVGLYAWGPGNPANGLFHSYQPGKLGPSNDPDQVTQIFSVTGADGTLSEFNTYANGGDGGSVSAGGTGNFWTGSHEIILTPGPNSEAIALTKSSFDPSIASGKHLKFLFFFNVAGGLGAGRQFEVFFTRNATISNSDTYNPGLDSSVALIITFQNYQSDGGGFDYQAIISMQRNPGETINSETGPCFSGGGSCYMAQSILYSNGAYSPNTLTQMGFWLNYTGNSGSSTNPSGNGACAGTGSFPQGGPGCTVEILTPSGTIRPDTGVGTVNVPYLPFQGEKYYIGMVNNKGNNNLALGLNTGSFPNQIDPGGSLTASGSFQIGAATIISTPVPVSPTIDTGGWFGPLIRAFINLGIFIFNGLLAFIGFITPALEAALSFLESIVQNTLNLIGSAFGFPTLGTTLFTFINTIISVFTTAVPNAFSEIVNIFNGWLNSISIIFTTGLIGQIFTFLSAMMTFGLNIVVFAFGLFTTALSWTTIFVPFWIFIWYFGFNADDGMEGWLKTFDFCKWLAFDIGVKFISNIINWTLDVITALMAILPKPFVQIAGKFPRIPIIEIHGSFGIPGFHGSALREGNLFSILGMLGGFIAFVWYELTQTSIPGTLANEFSSSSFVTGATTAIVFYKLFLPMATLVVFLLMIPTLFTRIFGPIRGLESGIALPTVSGHFPSRGFSRPPGSSTPLFRKREAGKRSSGFIKSRLGKIEERERDQKLRNEREEEERQKQKSLDEQKAELQAGRDRARERLKEPDRLAKALAKAETERSLRREE